MYLKRVLYGLAAGLLVFISSVSNSSAAPQILGLVVTMAPTPLLCGDRVCKAEFTSFCLQKERDVPHVSWAYEVAGGKSLHLVVIGRDGVEHRIAAAPHMTIRAHRGFAAVELSLSREKLVELGGVSVSIDVGSGVSLCRWRVREMTIRSRRRSALWRRVRCAGQVRGSLTKTLKSCPRPGS